MARLSEFSQFLRLFVYSSGILCCLSSLVIVNANHELDENNWRDMLEGEWMVEFYAPWCPACTALQPVWKDLAVRTYNGNMDVKTGSVDVTVSPGLSGRFIVTALPTIFHVKNGEFRQYKGPRDVESMINYVKKETWKQTDPIPSWKSPDSIHMTLIAEFFKLSQGLRAVHTKLMEDYGLPTWGSYLIFAIATIIIGAIMGLLLVCFIDLAYPPKRPCEHVKLSQGDVHRLARGDPDAKERSDDEDLINDDIVDDAEEDSDAEKHSPPDSSEEEKGDSKSNKSEKLSGSEREDKPEVRKRRPRKAD